MCSRQLVSYVATGTAYYPDPSALEGGFDDDHGNPLCTIQDHAAGRKPYCSVAMDSNLNLPYGMPLCIPELEQRFARRLTFLVVDTGSAFEGKGWGRIDICVDSEEASYDQTINGPLTLIRLEANS